MIDGLLEHSKGGIYTLGRFYQAINPEILFNAGINGTLCACPKLSCICFFSRFESSTIVALYATDLQPVWKDSEVY